MMWLRSLFARVRGVWRADQINKEIDDELQFHIDMCTEENVRRGMTPEEARRDAQQRFGHRTQIKERGYEVRGGRWLETLGQDLRYGVRTLRKNPSFSLVAIMALALGIGANIAIFSVVNAVLLRPLPFAGAERIVLIQESTPQSPAQVTPANFLDWREQNKVFEQMSAISTRRANLTDPSGEPQRVSLAVTSTNFFEVLGVRPLLGRTFLPEEEKAGHASVVIVSHGLWQRRFGSDPNLVGKQIAIDGMSYTVIGVTPSGVQYPRDTELWVSPRRIVPEADIDLGDITQVRGMGLLAVVARLKPGVSVEQAQAEMDTITGRLRQQYPETNSNRFDKVIPLHESIVGDVRPALLVLLGAVGCVLAIACANVANLLLARAAFRQKEMAVRTALGASRSRLLRQLLTESVLLSLIGGIIGLVLAVFGVDWLVSLAPSDIPRLEDTGLDRWVLVFTLLISLATGILFGLIPALQASKTDLNESLKEGARGATIGGRRTRLRGVLVVAEVALSLVLLIAAGLLFRSFLTLQAVKLGFEPRNVLTMRIAPTGENYSESKSQRAFYSEVLHRVGTLPGVEAVGGISTLPLSKGPVNGYEIDGRPPLTPDRMPGANRRNISPDYLRAMGISLLKGRAFTESDNADAPGVVIINEALAARDFAGEDPIGKRMAFSWRDGQPVWLEIVGVASDVRSLEVKAEPKPEAYTPYLQNTVPEMSFVIRTKNGPSNLVAAVQHEVYAIDKNQPVSHVRTMEQVVSEATTQSRFNMLLLAIFSGVALVLAAAGIYGVMAYSVAQRTHEIGIRIALGARPSDVLRLVIAQGARLTLIGAVVGLLGAFILMRVLQSLLYGVSATDPLTFIGVAVLLTVVALLASYIPARRATRVDPMVALRAE
jgi:putative ABC transport system permease protein